LRVAVLGLLCWIVYDRWSIRRYEGCDEYPSLASVIPPIQIWDTVAAVTYVAVTFIPVIGSWHTAAGAATIVLALGYQGNPYREGWYGSYDRAYADGYKLGHAERLKNWKPRANQVPPERVAPAYKDHAERLQPIQGAILPISHSVSTKRICPLLYFQPSASVLSSLKQGRFEWPGSLMNSFWLPSTRIGPTEQSRQPPMRLGWPYRPTRID
jgi:hypothetical protein